MILVTGATGNVGGEVVRALAGAGQLSPRFLRISTGSLRTASDSLVHSPRPRPVIPASAVIRKRAVVRAYQKRSW
jgi:nucleoside-diphosphate-sugar epimerase